VQFLEGFWSRSAAVNRLAVLAVVLLLCGVGIFARLVSLQVVQHEKYASQARSQQEHPSVIPAPRGTIFDRNGQILARSVPADSVSVNPQQIEDVRGATEILGAMLNLDQQALYAKLSAAKENHKGFLWIKHRVDALEAKRLKDLHPDYVTFHQDSLRRYPNGPTAAHILGAVFRGDKDAQGIEKGAAGVERSLEPVLKGHDGHELQVVDVHRRGIDSNVDKEPQAGTELTLTIDERMQYVAERELEAGVKAKNGRSGSVIVMNPENGEILALANYPSYDPNKPPKPTDDVLSRMDLGVSAPFEPGSIFKVVTLSAALETTNLRPDSPIATGGGSLALPGRVIHESHHGFGTISMAEVLAYSSNIGAILIGQRVGRENLYEYARRLGFGQRSGIMLPSESPGILHPVSKWGTTSLASISMGHEVSTTSVQLARLCAVMANGGLMVKPKLILKRGNKTEPTEPGVRVLKPETVMQMRMMMEGVVLNPRGTAHSTARLDGYTSAGKTGTAQIFDFATKHYTHYYNASFMGFTPVINPRLVIVVTVNRTAGDGGMGASAAGPIFNKIATEALRMMDVPKDIPETSVAGAKPAGKPVPPVSDLAIADLGSPGSIEEDPTLKQLVAEQMKMAAATEDDIPAARNTPQSFFAVAPAAPAQPVAPPVPSGPTVPDFRGKSMRAVVEEASADGIRVTIEGSGVARAQMPLPGMPLHNGEKIRIVFAR
jgi:cell division protein FtsI (penicillin-binding protein 3)